MIFKFILCDVMNQPTRITINMYDLSDMNQTMNDIKQAIENGEIVELEMIAPVMVVSVMRSMGMDSHPTEGPFIIKLTESNEDISVNDLMHLTDKLLPLMALLQRLESMYIEKLNETQYDSAGIALTADDISDYSFHDGVLIIATPNATINVTERITKIIISNNKNFTVDNIIMILKNIKNVPKNIEIEVPDYINTEELKNEICREVLHMKNAKLVSII